VDTITRELGGQFVNLRVQLQLLCASRGWWVNFVKTQGLFSIIGGRSGVRSWLVDHPIYHNGPDLKHLDLISGVHERSTVHIEVPPPVHGFTPNRPSNIQRSRADEQSGIPTPNPSHTTLIQWLRCFFLVPARPSGARAHGSGAMDGKAPWSL
jgi:hypothetical protein